MATFNCIVGAGGTLAVETPPRDMYRMKSGGPARAASLSIEGDPILMEMATSENMPFPKYRFELLTAAQATALNAILNAGGLVAFKSHSVATAETLGLAPRPAQVLEEIVGPYPDRLRDGSAIPDKLSPWCAEITFVRVG